MDGDEMSTATLVVRTAFETLPDRCALLESVGVTAEMDVSTALGLVCTALTEARGQVTALEPLAALGRQYRTDLEENALKAGVRAYGDGFDVERHQRLFASATSEDLRALTEQYEAAAAIRLPAGRATQDTEGPPAVKTTPAVPAAAFAG